MIFEGNNPLSLPDLFKPFRTAPNRGTTKFSETNSFRKAENDLTTIKVRAQLSMSCSMDFLCCSMAFLCFSFFFWVRFGRPGCSRPLLPCPRQQSAFEWAPRATAG